MDGVLVDSKLLHYKAFNQALSLVDPKFEINLEEHLRVYDGLPTRKKLELLTKNKGLPEALYSTIWENKQKITSRLLAAINYPDCVYQLFLFLRSEGFKLYIATNSIRDTTNLILSKLGIDNLVDGVITNEDVIRPKPHPEIYLRTILSSGCCPKECLILEDSVIGFSAAVNSGAHLMVISKLEDVNKEGIMKEIDLINNPRSGNQLFPFDGNVLIPMSGLGSRFETAGYVFPKPLIETINGKPMIQLVVESLQLKAHYIYVVRREHYEKYALKQMLNLITPGCDIVIVDAVTEGACCTTLLAKNLINNERPLIIANSDQYIEWEPEEFFYLMNNQTVDGGILTFNSTHPKWSYAAIDQDGFVKEVAEKKPISEHATVGVYYSKRGSDYVRYAEQMIKNNERVNGEFYVAPVWNGYIRDNKRVKIFPVDRMIGCGTPEDLTNLQSLLSCS